MNLRTLAVEEGCRVLGAGPLAGRPRWSILAYHRVVEDAELPTLAFPQMAVGRSAFEAALDWLARHARVVSLDAGLAAARRPPQFSSKPLVSITFDDGYRDNLEIAAPLLARRGMTAAFFVAAECLDGARPFWWDVLEDLSRSEEIPFGPLHDRFFAMGQREREEEIGALAARLAGRRGVGRYLASGDLQHLVSMGMTVGNHTSSHPYLDELDAAAIEREIAGAHARLRRLSGEPVRHFSYPNGRASRVVEEVLAAAGYASAVTTRPGSNGPEAHRYRLRRIDGRRLERGGRFSENRARFWLASRWPAALGDLL